MNFDVDNKSNSVISIKQLLNDSLKLNNFTYFKNKISKNVKDCSLLYTQVCYLIKLFLLYDYELNPNSSYNYKFDELFIRFCFRLIQNNNKNNNNLLNEDELKDNNNIYKRLMDFYNYFNNDATNNATFKCLTELDSISHITNALSRNIQTTIINNITINYYKYVKEYIKINLKLDFYQDDFTNQTINLVFNDIVNNTYYSNLKYHNWINKQKKLIIPNIDNKLIIKNIKDNNDNKQLLTFIKNYISNDTDNILNNICNVNKIKFNIQIKQSIYDDIINNKFNSNNIFHLWINESINLIISKFNESNTDLDKELKKDPYKFISFMLFMNKNLELNNSKKKYQIIPLRTNLTSKFIPINTNSLVDIIDSKYLKNVKNYYHNNNKNGLEVWNTFFKFNSDYIKRAIKKGYIFNDVIYTNGYEIIFNFIDNKYSNDKDSFHLKGRLERQLIKDKTKDLTDEEKIIFINEHNKKKEDEKEKKVLLNKEKVKKQKEQDKIDKEKILKNIKNELDILTNNIENQLKTLLNNHEKLINELTINLDKNDINYNNKVNEIIKEKTEKYNSDLAFINHCYKREEKTLIDDYDNKVIEQFNEISLLDKQIDKNIIEIKNKILIKKNELKQHKKTINPIKNVNIKSIIKLKKNITINIIENEKRIIKLNKLNHYNDQLYYECDDKSITKNHIKILKVKSLNLIKELYKTKQHKSLNEYIDAICLDNINELDIFILNKETKEVRKLINIISKSLLLDIKEVKHKNEELEQSINKLIINKNIIKSDDYLLIHKVITTKLDELSKELNKLLTLKIRNENKLKQLFKNKNNEYMKVDEMSKKYLEILDKLNWVVIDPGINTLFTMLSKDGKTTYNYTKSLHLNRTSRLKIEKKINNYKKKEIIKLEDELSKEDKRSRTSNEYKQFKTYFNKKMLMYEKLVNLYDNEKLNKLKWHMFINEKRSEKLLINDIKSKFGKDCVLILGDWSMNKSHIKGSSPTPNNKYTNIIEKNLLTLKINEFRTSIMHNKLDKRCENHKKEYNSKQESIKSIFLLEKIKKVNKEKYEKIKKTNKVHKILVCKTNEKSNGLFINRDSNSVKNMKKITLSYIKNNLRPKTYVFGTKICNHSLRVI